MEQEESLEKQKKTKKYEIDMTHGPLAGKLLLFAIPLMLSSMFQLLFNAADIVVVGRFAGSQALAAVGSNTALINLVTNLFIGLSVGANVVIANYYGAGKKEEISRTLHTGIYVALVAGIGLMIVGIFMARIFLTWMITPDDVIDLSTLYLRIYFLGMPALLVYNFGSAMMRASGDTRRPLYYLFFAGVLNVILNLILVIVFHLSVAGVAIATVTSQYASCGLIIRCLMRENSDMKLTLSKLRFDKSTALKIISIGLPAGFQGTVFALSNVVIQSSINTFGSVVVAGSAAAANIEGFVYMAMNAFYQTAITFAGQNFGARDLKRVKKVLGLCLLYVILTGFLFGRTTVIFAHELLRIYSPQEDVIRAGIVRMRYICNVYFLCGIMDVLVGILRGMGRAVMPMIVSIIGACGLRLLWIATIFRQDRRPEVLYISYPITWIITFTVHFICLFYVYQKEKKKCN